MSADNQWQCPNGCDEILSIYACELGVYFGCGERLWMSDLMRADVQES